MAGALITCPNCKSTLTFAQGLPANAILRCPICETTFAVRPAAVQAAASTPAPAKPAPTPPPMPSPRPAMPKAAAPRRATAPPVRPTAPADGKHTNGKSAPRPASAAAESGAGRIIGGVVLAAVALLFLGGLALLLWTQLPADRGTPNNDGGPGPVALNAKPGEATAPAVQENADTPAESPPVSAPAPKAPAPGTPVSGAPKKTDNPRPKDPDDDDLANLKKPKAAPPPEPISEPKPKAPTPPAPASKPDPEPEPKGKEGPVVPVVVPGTPLPPGVTVQRVDDAIAHGVQNPKRCQIGDGSWAGGRLGYAALCGLALLECHVPAKDPAIQKAAQYVRNAVLEQHQTYDTSTAVLFLDKLGDPRDRDLIRNLALRVLTSQNPCGGWGYAGLPVYAVDAQKVHRSLETHFPFSPKHPRTPTDGNGGAKAIRGAPGDGAPGKDGKDKDQRPIDLSNLPVSELLWNQWNPYMINPGD